MSTAQNRTDMAINTINVALGGILFASPWLLGFRHETWASLNAWVSGGVVVLLGLLAILHTLDWEEWLNAIAGLWIAASPWLLWFDDVASAFWAHIVIGLCIVGIAAFELRRLYMMPDTVISRPR